MREKCTAGGNNGGSGRDNSAVMVAMVCGTVISFILLAILLAIVCMKWYAHCLIMLTIKFSLSPYVAGDVSGAQVSVISPLSPLQLLVSQYS